LFSRLQSEKTPRAGEDLLGSEDEIGASSSKDPDYSRRLDIDTFFGIGFLIKGLGVGSRPGIPGRSTEEIPETSSPRSETPLGIGLLVESLGLGSGTFIPGTFTEEIPETSSPRSETPLGKGLLVEGLGLDSIPGFKLPGRPGLNFRGSIFGSRFFPRMRLLVEGLGVVGSPGWLTRESSSEFRGETGDASSEIPEASSLRRGTSLGIGLRIEGRGIDGLLDLCFLG